MLTNVYSFKQLSLNCSLTITDLFKPIFIHRFKEAKQYTENIKEEFGHFNYAPIGTFFRPENYKKHLNNMTTVKEKSTDSETESENGDEHLNNMSTGKGQPTESKPGPEYGAEHLNNVATVKKKSTDSETESEDEEEHLKNTVTAKGESINSETESENGNEHLNNMSAAKEKSTNSETESENGDRRLKNMIASKEGSNELEKNPTQVNDESEDVRDFKVNDEEKNRPSSSLKRPAAENSKALLVDTEKRLKVHIQDIYDQFRKVEGIFSDRIIRKHHELAELQSLLDFEKEKVENSEKRTKDAEKMNVKYLVDLESAENEKRDLRDELTKLKTELAAEKEKASKVKNTCIICNKDCFMFCGLDCMK